MKCCVIDLEQFFKALEAWCCASSTPLNRSREASQARAFRIEKLKIINLRQGLKQNEIFS